LPPLPCERRAILRPRRTTDAPDHRRGSRCAGHDARSDLRDDGGVRAVRQRRRSDRAAREADVIATCTRATEPLFDGALVRRGAFVAAIGSSKPAARELDDTLLARADQIVVEWLPAAQAEAGEFVRAAPAVIDPSRVVELGKLLVHGARYERKPADIVIYKSVGVGLEDVALAQLVWQRAQ
jgi:ornithine cyclodeaminase